MLEYQQSIFGKITIIVTLVIFAMVIYLLIKNNDVINLLWVIPSSIFIVFVFIGIWQTKILIDDEKIVQSFGHSLFFKDKVMTWEYVEYVVKDGLDDFPMCRLLSKSSNKTKMINIAGIRNMDSLIIEIVKRAKNAEIAPAFQELAKRESKK